MDKVVFVVAVAALALAGCFGGGDPGGTSSTDQPTANPTDEAGVLRGVVVDDAVRPLPAAVTVLGLNRTTQTAPDGTYAFDEVPPGAYLVEAVSVGFVTTRASTSVNAGQATDLRITLAKVVETAPFATTFDFTGFVSLSTGLVGALSQANDPTGLTACQCTFEASAEPGLSRLVLEATWDDWMTDPTGPTEFIWQVTALGPNAQNATAQGTSTAPLYKMLGNLDFAVAGFKLTNATGFEVHIYPDAVWPAFQQSYDAYLSLWYRGPPPDGWRIIPSS